MTHQHTRAKKKSKSIIPGFGLSFGIVMAILGIIVVIPLCSLVVFSARLSLSEFWQTITRPRVLSSYAVKSILLTLKVVVITVVVNTIFGLYAAWLITKFTFRGQKDHINAHRSAAYHIPDHRGPYIRTYIWQAELPVSIP